MPTFRVDSSGAQVIISPATRLWVMRSLLSWLFAERSIEFLTHISQLSSFSSILFSNAVQRRKGEHDETPPNETDDAPDASPSFFRQDTGIFSYSISNCIFFLELHTKFPLFFLEAIPLPDMGTTLDRNKTNAIRFRSWPTLELSRELHTLYTHAAAPSPFGRTLCTFESALSPARRAVHPSLYLRIRIEHGILPRFLALSPLLIVAWSDPF